MNESRRRSLTRNPKPGMTRGRITGVGGTACCAGKRNRRSSRRNSRRRKTWSIISKNNAGPKVCRLTKTQPETRGQKSKLRSQKSKQLRINWHRKLAGVNRAGRGELTAIKMERLHPKYSRVEFSIGF